MVPWNQVTSSFSGGGGNPLSPCWSIVGHAIADRMRTSSMFGPPEGPGEQPGLHVMLSIQCQDKIKGCRFVIHFRKQVATDGTYCWWFRNPAVAPVEVGSLSHYLQGFTQVVQDFFLQQYGLEYWFPGSGFDSGPNLEAWLVKEHIVYLFNFIYMPTTKTLGGGFNFLFSSLFGEIIQFD